MDDQQAEDKQKREGQQGDKRQDGEQQNGQQQKPIPLSEWVVAIVGALLVLASIGYMTYEAIFGLKSPPDVTVQVTGVQPVQSGYLVEVQAQNIGGSTAAAVVVEGVLKQGEETVETSQASIDYVPSQSQRGAGLFFSYNPADFDLSVRAMGYQEP
jgi:uncharacterized protein (TIGR02588 family)